MRVPVSWLGDWVDLPEDISLERLHADLVKVGFEEEDVVTFDLQGPIVVGEVLSAEAEPQTNGKTINWCSVDVGPSTLRDGAGAPPQDGAGSGQARDIRGIVCGAHNFSAGDRVIVTLPGSVLPGPFPIAARKTYGHVSDGMIASARELAWGDEHDGILRLADLGIDAPVGADAIELLHLDDAAVDVNVTPDRGYAFSIRGIAREYAHSTGAAFRDPAHAVELPASAPSGYPFRFVDDARIRGREGIVRASFRIVRGVDAARPTPPWLKTRLILAGMRSVSLVVDITNYVMLELGQPIHGYDLDRIEGGITIRRAAPGESLETLDGKTRELAVEDLVVADDAGAVGIGGVMGGARTETSETTRDVLVEAVCFDAITSSRSQRRHRLFSEAARRFERGVDPELAPIASKRVADLLVELAGGTLDESVGVDWGAAPTIPSIRMRLARPEELTGVAYSDDEITGTLEAIGCAVVRDGDALTVTPPSWRPDLVDDAGLVEEVARITGYDRIGSELPVAPPGRGLTREQTARRRTAQTLAGAGLVEVLGYPFQSAESVELFTPGGRAFRVENALDAREAFLRLSLLPGLVQIAQRNVARGLTDVGVYEIGRVFGDGSGDPAAFGTVELPPGGAALPVQQTEALAASVPPQPWRVGALMAGDVAPRGAGQRGIPAGIADALDVVREVALAAAVPVAFRAGEHPALHPGRTAEVLVGDTVVGIAGELRPALAAELDLHGTVAVVELDLDRLIELAPTAVSALPIGTHPAATQDVSLVVDVSYPAETVRTSLVEGAGELLEDAVLVDDYRGAGLPDGTRSLTFALRFRAPDRTLTAAEATEAKLAGVALASERTGARIRE